MRLEPATGKGEQLRLQVRGHDLNRRARAGRLHRDGDCSAAHLRQRRAVVVNLHRGQLRRERGDVVRIDDGQRGQPGHPDPTLIRVL
jgi:hypothetical protein